MLWTFPRIQKEAGKVWEACQEGNGKQRAAFCQHAPASSVPTNMATRVRCIRRRRRYQLRLRRTRVPMAASFEPASFEPASFKPAFKTALLPHCANERHKETQLYRAFGHPKPRVGTGSDTGT